MEEINKEINFYLSDIEKYKLEFELLEKMPKHSTICKELIQFCTESKEDPFLENLNAPKTGISKLFSKKNERENNFRLKSKIKNSINKNFKKKIPKIEFKTNKITKDIDLILRRDRKVLSKELKILCVGSMELISNVSKIWVKIFFFFK